MKHWKGLVAGGVVSLAAVGAASVALSQTDARGFTRIMPKEVKWVPYAGPPGELGMKQAVVYGDPTKPGVYILRLKFPKGVMSRPHSHPDDRMALVIRGTWWTGTGETFDPASTVPVPPGGFMVHPKGEFHYDGAKGQEVELQMIGFGPTGKKPAHPEHPDFSKQ